MIKKKILMMTCVGALVAFPLFAQSQENLIVRNNAVVVCRSKQCKSARSMMTSEFLYNKLGSLLKNNINKKVLFCDAEPNVHVCLNDAISFDVKAGAAGTTVRIPAALLVDAKAVPDKKEQKFVLDYNMELGDTYPTCQASLNQMQVLSADKINIEAPGFECRFTENGMTVVNASYEVDYIDFDYGILGAHYTVAVGQVSKGGKNGYALLRFEKPTNANNELQEECGCSCTEEQDPPCQCGNKETEVKTIIQEKVVTQYEVAPIEVYVKTKAPIEAGQVQNVRINGVEVPNVPVVVDAPKTSAVVGDSVIVSEVEEMRKVAPPKQILKPGVPVIMDVEEEVSPGQVRAVSNWE